MHKHISEQYDLELSQIRDTLMEMAGLVEVQVNNACTSLVIIDIDHEPTRWDLSDLRRSQLWGFPAPRKWFNEATCFENQPVHPPMLDAPPVTLEDFLEGWSQ